MSVYLSSEERARHERLARTYWIIALIGFGSFVAGAVNIESFGGTLAAIIGASVTFFCLFRGAANSFRAR